MQVACVSALGLCLTGGLWVLGFPVLISGGRFTPTPEGRFFDALFLGALFLYALVYLLASFRLLDIWLRLKPALGTLAMLPVGDAVKRVAGTSKLQTIFGRFVSATEEADPGSEEPDEGRMLLDQYQRRLHQEKAVVALLPRNGEGQERPRDCPELEGRPHPLVWAVLPSVLEDWDARAVPRPSPEPAVPEGDAVHSEHAVGVRAVSVTADETFATDPLRGGTGEAGGDAAGAPGKALITLEARVDKKQVKPSGEPEKWRAVAEEYVLASLVMHLRRFAPALRRVFGFLTLSPVLLLMAISFYPFQPQRMLTMLVWVMVLGGLGLSFWVQTQIDRDPFVSLVSGTKPNATFDLKFIEGLKPFLVPLAGLVLTVFPDLAFSLRVILEPIGRALK